MDRTSVARSVRSRVGAMLAVALLGVAVAACRGEDALPRPSEEFCVLAFEYDQDIARIGPDDPDGHLAYLEPMRELAPDDIRDDLDVVTEAMRRLRGGDESVVGDPDVEAAVDRYQRRAIDGCRLHDQDPPGGF